VAIGASVTWWRPELWLLWLTGRRLQLDSLLPSAGNPQEINENQRFRVAPGDDRV
jgi:hypothetical protein